MDFELIETSKKGLVGLSNKALKSQMVVAMPVTDKKLAMKLAHLLLHRASMPCHLVIIMDTIRQGFIKTINDVAQRLQPEYLVYLAQDAFPGKHWLRLAFEGLQNTSGGVFCFNDGEWFGNLAAFGLVNTRFSHSLYGDNLIFCPLYHSHYADTELSILAAYHGKLIYDPHAVLVEVDYDVNGGRVLQRDRETYHRRMDKELGLPPDLAGRFR
jgi:hypothetical protein